MKKTDLNEPGIVFRPDTQNVSVEKPLMDDEIKKVNGKYANPEDEDEDTEDDLILGDEDELEGDEMEFEVELEEDINVDDISEDDLILDPAEDVDEEDEDL